jgi:hypothetical protein
MPDNHMFIIDQINQFKKTQGEKESIKKQVIICTQCGHEKSKCLSNSTTAIDENITMIVDAKQPQVVKDLSRMGLAMQRPSVHEDY